MRWGRTWFWCQPLFSLVTKLLSVIVIITVLIISIITIINHLPSPPHHLLFLSVTMFLAGAGTDLEEIRSTLKDKPTRSLDHIISQYLWVSRSCFWRNAFTGVGVLLLSETCGSCRWKNCRRRRWRLWRLFALHWWGLCWAWAGFWVHLLRRIWRWRK